MLGPLINSVFLVSLCLTIVIEAIERLFEEKEIKDPNLLLIVGCIGLGINLIGLFVFGHAHSHNVPSLPDDDDSSDSDTDTDPNKSPSVRTDEADTLQEDKQSNEMNEREKVALVLEAPTIVAVAKSAKSDKKKAANSPKNKKKAKCHILCK